MNGWNLGAVIAAVIAIVSAATAFGQNVATSTDHSRRLAVLEAGREDVQDLAVEQARTGAVLEAQTKAIDALTKSVQTLTREIQTR